MKRRSAFVLLSLFSLTLIAFSHSASTDRLVTGAVSLTAGRADPGHFGLPVPVPEPELPPGVDAFEPPFFEARSSAPAIAEISATADRDEVVSMTGVKLDGETVFDVFSQAPTAPEGHVTSLAPLTKDAAAATLLLPSTLPPWSMYLVRPRRGASGGRAFAINRTEAWWVGPDKGTPGTVVSVYGRNLARSNKTAEAHIYIKPIDGSGRYLRPISVNPFRVSFEIPDLPSAAYEVWMHNGHGGRFGWSGPLRLDVLSRSSWAGQEDKVISVKGFGAAGNGVADDTAAIEKALQAATAAAPATVHFPAGTYLVTAPLKAPANVAWTGEGMDETEIRLGRNIDQSMVASEDDNVQFRQITLNGNRGTGDKPLLRLSSARDTRLEAMRINAWGTAALDAQDASGLFIHASELIENGSFYGTSRQVFLSENRFRMTGYGESVVALWGGRDFSMIGNELTNADESRDDGHGIGRFFVAQAHFGSLRNLYWERNVSRNAAPHDCEKVDCNKGEQICFEIVGSMMKNDFVRASASSVTFRSLADWGKPVASGRDLVIIGGRGAGQHRHITSIDGSTVTIETPWNVIPDKTSRFALAAIASQAVIYDNTFEGRASFSEHDSDSTGVLLYGNVYDVVVDSNNISQMRHGMMTVALDSTYGLSPYFLQYSNNSVSRSNSGLYIGTTFADSGVAGIWGGLGNVYRKNSFDDITYIGVEYETWDHDGSDYNATVFDGNRFTNLRYGFVDAYKLMWTHDGVFKAAPQKRPRRFNTILYRNHFRRGSADIEGSKGFLTMHPGNTWLNIGSTWEGFASGNAGPDLRSGER
ncbi:glycoside hydrolase family 28 protein [Neorhizobium sp. CSC1952]|uniref:glycosyl hydrolase family 28-related protein n=1 Tax=Neorhizobium sp. CSC1952 TaxID=2978974 RepID=UPI0025A62D2D|nr:glycoside hydrolase family 28 protein [Rhizobium sp. CSC1952]WJR67049.1 glycoside hydrolase family 28 protein [Rhizobium sp. CSC1952]